MPQPDLHHVLSLSLGDKLDILRKLAPRDTDALEQLVNDALRYRWPKRTPIWIKARLRPTLVKQRA